MKTQIRAFFLMCLMAAALWTALQAYHSIRGPWDGALPAELYASLQAESEGATYILRAREGRVAVCTPRSIRGGELTTIELSTLRAADRAMLRRGIPAADRRSLLMLLEDLGS